MSLFDLSGKTAVVTGSTQGIGRGIAEQLVRQGANVVVSSRNADRCDAAAEAINRTLGRPGETVAKAVPFDLILIGSLAGHSVNPGLLAYSVSKAGVAHMSRILADEFAADGIRVNCVSPGFIRSESSGPVFARPDALAQIVSGIPLQRPGEPEDVAGAVVFLASRAGSYVTGETILVDGGRVNLNPPRPKGEDANAALRSVAEKDKGGRGKPAPQAGVRRRIRCK